MINCNYAAIDEYQFFITVVGEKQQASQRALNPLVPRVTNAYQTYLNNFAALCLQPASLFVADLPEVRDVLQKCYGSPTLSFKQFKSDYYDNQPAAIVELCPYCMIDTPYSLDHYVGQTEFPEYSILTKNLVPCCLRCNNEKNKGWRTNSVKTFINFYDDRFLQHRFLFADLMINAGVPSLQFRLSQPAQITNDQFALINRHFVALELLVKYAKKSNNRLTAEIQSIKDFMAAGRTNASIIEDLTIRYRSSVRQYGPNYWESLVYPAIASSLPVVRHL
ncbi:HNH endonuclease [Mucilaginibacter jinjuensis]|uniref:HNH endonuclease n=1 Tax=Mucilaginibacter jinjuensis TaxID=1176721 RepID=A0ABY7T5B5_9SPHI|nr:hypothetical protein [Mucilaginibacter jinjuensis]WCT11566.1 hypothetical protein PQO05_22765 [Mucilaginibacter jinjuensis]